MTNCNSCDDHQTRPGWECLEELPLAMAYVPWQTFHDTCELSKALQIGTIFPELHKPFCGKRGVCR